jgi:hypothetical protein
VHESGERAKLVSSARFRRQRLVAQIVGQFRKTKAAPAQITDNRGQGFRRVNAATVDMKDQNVARLGQLPGALHQRVAVFQGRRVPARPRPVHDLVTKAFGQGQIGVAVVSGREAEEPRLAVGRCFNRGVRMHDLVAHLAERQPLHMVRVTEGMIFDLDEIEPRKLRDILQIGFHEPSGNEHRKRDALVEQIVEHGAVESDRRTLFAGIERKRDDLFVGRQPRDDIGASDRWRNDRSRKRSAETNPPHAP